MRLFGPGKGAAVFGKGQIGLPVRTRHGPTIALRAVLTGARRLRAVGLASLGCLALVLIPPAASASQIISTSGVSDLTLGVNAKGEAMLSYVSRGKTVHVLAWGALNAIPTPNPTATAVSSTFQLYYDGGYTKYFRDNPAAVAAVGKLRDLQTQMAKATAAKDNPTRYVLKPEIAEAYKTIATLRNDATNYWRTFTCPSYQGVQLKGVLAACAAPDGSTWALESRSVAGASRTVTAAAGEAAEGIQLVRFSGADVSGATPRGVTSSAASDTSLGVNDLGEAMVTYRAQGRVFHVLASSASTAPPAPVKQVSFQLAYDGGYTKYFRQNPAAHAALTNLRGLQAQMAKATAANDNSVRWKLKPKIAAAYAAIAALRNAATNYWRTFSCPAYTGPSISDMVAACTAPDGSYWAVQSWDRDLPDYGETANVAQSQMEVHLAHWTGDSLPILTVHTDWSYAGRWNHLWGTYTYSGMGVYGLTSTSIGVPLDNFGRNLYVDTYNSAYGSGWRRENSFLTHRPNGSWCYSVNPHGSHPAGTGTEYRLTILGPGVAPDVSVTVAAPAPYDKANQARSDGALSALDDPSCVPHEGGTSSTSSTSSTSGLP